MLSRSHSNLDEAALRNQLGQAKLKISSLEDYIQQREVAFQVRVRRPDFTVYSLACLRNQFHNFF